MDHIFYALKRAFERGTDLKIIGSRSLVVTPSKKRPETINKNLTGYTDSGISKYQETYHHAESTQNNSINSSYNSDTVETP